MRATARVFLVKNFFTYQYDYRVEWYRLINRLYRIDDLSSPYEKAIKALAEIVDSPGGAIWAKQDQEKYFKPISNWNFPLPENTHTSPESPLVKLLTEHNWIIDSRNDNNPSDSRNHYPEWLISLNQWWLIIPLSHESKLISFVILTESRAPHNLSWEDLDLLKTAAQQIAAYLAQYEISQSLSQARQFQTFNQLSTFLMHDLKNLIAQQSLLVQNANRHKHNPVFVDDMIATIDDSVQRMSHILNQLQDGKESRRKAKFKIGKLIENAISTSHDRLPCPTLKIDAHTSNMEIVIDNHAFAMVLLHLIRNAQDACTNDDTIEIHITVQAPYIMIDVSDTGCGMTQDFIRNRLFTPFDSTKSSRGMGIGAYQARTFARLHGGDVEVESDPGVGTKFRLWFLTTPISDDSLEAETNS
ncbi:hypothetical protein BI364_04505 [Acidihalobacter yilgarnensis]|uniref:histidine kinase n=2 Tax=Acidihalobacter yilgarnensis TaxID=2819280 RepID=A0A1D8ILK9_9GAMM|nr:hypothetical protein BI364_04505 [Acidihalobacter yilgarnensis]